MKILYLAPDAVPAPKGAAVRIQRTVETLRGLGHEVDVFTPAPRGLGSPGRDGVPLEESNFLRRMIGLREEAERWLRDRSGDLVQFRSIWEGIPAVAWAKGKGVPALLEAHGFPSIELPYHYPGLERRDGLLEKIIREERRVIALSRHVVTPSKTGARFLMRMGVPPSGISVVPNCVDADLFSPGGVPPPDEGPYRLVYEGTLAPWQGLPGLLEAIALLRNSHALELHVVGPARSAWRASIRRMARRLRIHHAVHVSGSMAQADLVPVLRTAHVCVAPLPSDPRNALQGCCPLKILEYMASGRPILSTSIAPVEEILEDGVTARLVGPGSAAALAEGLAWMVSHPKEREALGAAARDAALARWTPRHFEASLEDALARATREGPPGRPGAVV